MSEAGVAVPVAVMGLGEIGRRVARAALTVPGLELVSAADAAPSIAGRPLGEVLVAAAPDVRVQARAAEAFAAVRKSMQAQSADGDVRGVLLHATGSRLESVIGELEEAVRAGLNVVSSCEELACPWVRHEKLADRLDRLAEQHGVTVVGVGVNPGFVLDRLVATLAQATGKVQRVDGLRVVDASTRREALQRKIGAGLSEAAFHEAVEAGRIGHVGLMESAALAAMGVGRACDEVDEEIVPVIATTELRVPWGVVKPGEVCGVQQVARAFEAGAEVVRLELHMAIGAKDPRDEITIQGEPPITLRIPGGTPGDDATAWAMVHAAEALGHGAEPGLVTVLDLPAGR